MDLNAGVSVGQLLISLIGVVLAGGVTWGGLLQRVKTLEREVQALAGFAERLTRIEERTGYVAQQIDKITGSWLFKEPPPYGSDDFNRSPRRSRGD
jgi:hypothetical protein